MHSTRPHCCRLASVLLLTLAASAVPRAAAQLEDLPPVDSVRRGPAVTAVMEMSRDTPRDQLLALFTLLDLGEYDLAASVWQELKAEEINDETRVQLVERFGTARFLNLARRDQPLNDAMAEDFSGARDFAQQCLDAAVEAARDPARLAKLIAAAQSDDAATRASARTDLAATGTAGDAALLGALAKAGTEDSRKYLMLALADMRPGVDPLLIAALIDGSGQFRRDVAELTGFLRMRDAAPWLGALAAGGTSDSAVASAASTALGKMGYTLPSAIDATAVLRSEMHRLAAQSADLNLIETEETWWTYSADQDQLVPHEVSATVQQQLAINRLARVLGEMPGATESDRRLALLAQYQSAQLLGEQVPEEITQLAQSLSIAALLSALDEALAANQISAAVACANLLGERADPAALYSLGANYSPLVAAVQHGDRRVRFAALQAIMKISPQEPFAGSSAVPRALWEFLAGSGSPQAIAASSNNPRAVEWAGMLRGLGYDAVPVVTGQEAIRTAVEMPRLALVVIDSDIGRPRLREVIYQLRSSGSVDRTPIAILSSVPNLPVSQSLAAGDRWMLATARPQGAAAFGQVAEQLQALAADVPGAELQSKQAEQALAWLNKLLTDGHPYDELLRDSQMIAQTVYSPKHSGQSLGILALLGTAESQRMLIDFVSTQTQSLELRQAALTALKASIDRFGKLLTSDELARQYDRYNASETADADTQKLLGQVLDLLEGDLLETEANP